MSYEVKAQSGDFIAFEKPEIIFPIHSQNPGKLEELAKDKKISGIVKRLESKVSVDPAKILKEER